MFLLTCEVVAKWIEYCVLKASIKVRSCTFEFTAIVIDRRVCWQKSVSWSSEVYFRELAYLNHFQLDLVVPIFRAAANRLDDCVDEQTRSFSIKCRRFLAIFVLAIVRTVTIEEFVAKKFLNSVQELLHEAWEFTLDRHLEDVKVFVCTQLFFILVCCYLFYGRAKILDYFRKYLRRACWQSSISSLFLLLLTDLMILFKLSSISSL